MSLLFPPPRLPAEIGSLNSDSTLERGEDDEACQPASEREETICYHGEAVYDNGSEAKAERYEVCVLL